MNISDNYLNALVSQCEDVEKNFAEHGVDQVVLNQIGYLNQEVQKLEPNLGNFTVKQVVDKIKALQDKIIKFQIYSKVLENQIRQTSDDGTFRVYLFVNDQRYISTDSKKVAQDIANEISN